MRAHVATALRDDFQESNRGFCRLRNRDGTECGGAGTIAADGNPQHIAAVIRLRFEPHVCRYSIKAERAAAVDDDGDFQAPAVLTSDRCASLPAQIGSEGAGIEEFRRVDAGEGIASEPECRPGPQCRARQSSPQNAAPSAAVQAAHLDAAARGDFDDAVAVRARGGAERGERIERNGADRKRPRPTNHRRSASARKAQDRRRDRVPSPLWGGVRGGGREISDKRRRHHATSRPPSLPSPQGGGVSARSAARPASTSLRARMPKAAPPRGVEPLRRSRRRLAGFRATENRARSASAT